VKPWAEVDGVDWHALVAAATGKDGGDPQAARLKSARVFGEILRALRTSKGMTTDELAARANMDAHRLEAIDAGLSEPDVVEVFGIADALGISPSELVKKFEDQA
jgi:ribosome-binding protein aMBF1 (putative translation factor)